ncbi:zinc finger MYM-type protein 5-like [Centruroides sculpturatus]|uniref:zinc finger MYM-type protein 5-like n=1 Tax=Centruroides sculpturatus TaxID=218467 RepID=UPI000C6E2D24|nr:zinc finger MYM-type protein 5-like [Centruroides sculpturatus]
MSKQLSGAQKRNIRKRKLEECKSMSQQFVKWLSTETLENRGCAEEVKPTTASQADDSTLHLTSTPSMNDNSQRSKNKEPLQEVKSTTSQDILLQLPHNNSKEDEPAQSTVSQIDNTVQNMCSTVPEEILLNYNDPHSWPTITNKLIYSLVIHGPDQGDNVNFNTLKADDSGRKFTKDWFYVKQINGEIVKRKWILYSINQNAVFCFSCMLFGHKSHNLSDPQKEFHDWRHLHPVIPLHENSPEHRNSYVKWKVMEKNLKFRKCNQ